VNLKELTCNESLEQIFKDGHAKYLHEEKRSGQSPSRSEDRRGADLKVAPGRLTMLGGLPGRCIPIRPRSVPYRFSPPAPKSCKAPP
jgi:hypothetical protein